MLFDWPSEEDWRHLDAAFPFNKLEMPEGIFRDTSHPDGSIENVIASEEIFTWRLHLKNRLSQTHWTFLVLMFFYNKGIPDKEWFISPGRKGQSVEYFPHFEEKDHLVKVQFYYFADVFYCKLFSAWDTIGHLLNVTYDLKIKQASFDRVVKKLEIAKPSLYSELNGIMLSPDFVKMRKFRNDVTHNHLLGQIGPHVKKGSGKVTLGIGNYISSDEIKENVVKSLDLFAETLNAIKEVDADDESV